MADTARTGKADKLARSRRVEGQVRGPQRMAGAGGYRIDVLTQVSAATRSLQSSDAIARLARS